MRTFRSAVSGRPEGLHYTRKPLHPENHAQSEILLVLTSSASSGKLLLLEPRRHSITVARERLAGHLGHFRRNLTLADGHAERVAALHMIEPRADRPQAITLGADKAYDAEDFINELRSMKVTPHVAQNTSGRSSAIDGRTTRHGGYAISQRIRKRIEEAFGWIKTVAGQEKTRFRGRDRVAWAFTLAAAAYNLVRLPKLVAGAG